MKEQQRKCDVLVDIHSIAHSQYGFSSFPDAPPSVHMFLSLILSQLLRTW